jgi:uncharacterized protein DUF6508
MVHVNDSTFIRKAGALLGFLQFFDPPQEPHQRSQGGSHLGPIYHDHVVAFFTLASDDYWMEEACDFTQLKELIADDRLIDSADLSTLRRLLTYCVRGESILDGHWGSMVNQGRIVAILRRMSDLRNGGRAEAVAGQGPAGVEKHT